MAFGFDPGIILSAKSGPQSSVNDTLQTLANLQTHRAQQQQHQATLADMVRKQQHEQTLAGIYKRNASNPEAVAADLMAGGFGGPALEWREKESGIASRKATAQKIGSGLYQEGLKRLAGRLRAVETPEQYAQVVASIPPEELAQLGLTAEFDPAARDIFVSGATSADRPSSRVIVGADGQQYVVNANDPDAAPTLIRDARGNPIKARPQNTPMVLVQGEGGTQYWGNPQKPDAPVKPVVDNTGNPVLKPQPAADKLAERNVGGYTFDPKNPPSPDGAKKMANVVIAKDNALSALDRLEALFDKHGTQLYGDIASEMESEWKTITDQVRIQSEMGVPNGGDYPMLAKQIPNPSGKEGALQLKSSIKAKFGVLRRQMNKTVDATAKAYKYSPEAAPGEPPKIKSEAEFNALASGAEFIDPEGNRRRKP